MNKFKDFFFDYENIKSGYTKEENSYFFNSLSSKNLNSSSLKGEENQKKKEVVVKLISNLNLKQTIQCMKYITREDSDQENELKNEFGEKTTLQKTIKEWNLDKKEKSKECLHLMFSIQESKSKENFEKLEIAVLETMRENFPDHSFVFTIHSHQNNPHVHLIFKKRDNIRNKKLHFNSKDEIRNLFAKMRSDFSIALRYKSLDYVATKKIARLDKMLEQYHSLEKRNKNSVGEYSQILLKQLTFHKQNREELLERINQAKSKQLELRSALSDMKLHQQINDDFFNKINSVKLFNKKISSYYRILSSTHREEKRITKEFLRFEQKIKPLLGKNLHTIETLKYLDQKIGKNALSKHQLQQLNNIRSVLLEKQKQLDTFYSPLCEIFKKDLTMRKLGSMLIEQKRFQNPKIEEILLNEIKNRHDFFVKNFMSGNKLNQKQQARLPFILKEVDFAKELLKRFSTNSETALPALKQQSQTLKNSPHNKAK